MRQGPILAAANHFLGVRVDDHDASTGVGPDVGFAVLVGGHVPGYGSPAPVVQNVAIGSAPLGPVVLVVGVVVVGAALGEIHLDVGMGGQHFAHHARYAHIAMPGNRVYVSSEARI